MAVTSVKLINVDGGIGKKSVRDYTKVYQVETDDINDGPITARTAAGIEARLSTFSHGNDVDAGAELVTKRATLVKARDTYKQWKVVCKWMTPDPASGEGENPDDDVDDPLLFRTKWSGSYLQFTRDFQQDKDSSEIVNSVGDPFLEPPITGDDSRLSIIAEKNYAALNVPVWAQFRDAVNDATYWGLGARKIKVQSITWNQAFHNQAPYYQVRMEFSINDSTWDVVTLNAGFHERVSGARTRIADRLGRDINHPLPLAAASTGDILALAASSTSVNYITSKLYTEKDFTLLGLPSTIGAP